MSFLDLCPESRAFGFMSKIMCPSARTEYTMGAELQSQREAPGWGRGRFPAQDSSELSKCGQFPKLRLRDRRKQVKRVVVRNMLVRKAML